MRKIALFSLLLLSTIFFMASSGSGESIVETEVSDVTVAVGSGDLGRYTEADIKRLYDEIKLDGVINFAAFSNGINGYNKIENKHKKLLSIIDYSKPSSEERFYLLDIENNKLLLSTYVAHGRNSGEKYATSFSNIMGSYQSSLGFFLTGMSYDGKNGISLELNGLEKGINDKARQRAVVIHGADYCDPSVVAQSGRLGRSLGCPSLPRSVAGDVINQIKGGSVLYIFANEAEYYTKSEFFNKGA